MGVVTDVFTRPIVDGSESACQKRFCGNPIRGSKIRFLHVVTLQSSPDVCSCGCVWLMLRDPHLQYVTLPLMRIIVRLAASKYNKTWARPYP